MDLSIIIVNWNTRMFLDGCLASIFRETKNINFEIFVVDNGSSDGSAQMVKEKYPAVKLIENKENRGFAAANNQAIKEAAGQYILALNPDTVILNDCLEAAVEKMDTRPDAGILSVKTLNRDGSIQKVVRRDPTLLTQLILPSKMKKIFPDWAALKGYYCDDFDYEKEGPAEQLQGSFLLMRREALDKIGLFDEKFFIWFEEVDLCRRAKCAGFNLLYFPGASIIHYGGESFAQLTTLKKQGLYARSLLYYFWKNKQKWQFFILYIFKLPFLIF